MRDTLPIGPLAALRLHWQGWAREHPTLAAAIEIAALLAVGALIQALLFRGHHGADGAGAPPEFRNPQSAIRNENALPRLPSKPGQEAGAGAGGPRPPAAESGGLWRVTAYCPCERCCGRWADGRTASGTPANRYMVAAPPEIPFGAVVTIPGYGTVFVADRGGAIRGRRLDVLMPTHTEALAWGVRWLKVREAP